MNARPTQETAVINCLVGTEITHPFFSPPVFFGLFLRSWANLSRSEELPIIGQWMTAGADDD